MGMFGSLNLPALVRDGVVFEMVLAISCAAIQSHLLIHAGVVARNGEALLFSADSFHGKDHTRTQVVAIRLFISLPMTSRR